jgi:hypothetical protein
LRFSGQSSENKVQLEQIHGLDKQLTFAPGKSGNPKGRPTKEKTFTDALRAALNQVDPKTKRRKLLDVADKLVECAIDGEGWAICQVADRLDGKPHSESTLNVNDNRSLSELADAEIVARIEELRAGRTQPVGRDGEAEVDSSQLN